MHDNRYRHSAYSCVRSKDGNRIVSRRLGERQRAARAQKLSILPFLEQGGIKANCSHFQTPKLHWALRRDAWSRVTREAYICIHPLTRSLNAPIDVSQKTITHW